MPDLIRLCAGTALVLLALPWTVARSAETLPYDCATLAKTIGAPATEMTPAPDEGWQHAPDEARLVCTWYNGPAAKALEGETLAGEDWSAPGALTAQIVVHESPLPRGAAAVIKAAYDLPEEIGKDLKGAWLMSLKTPEFSEVLGLLAPELYLENLSVSIAWANGFAAPQNSESALTVGWSVERAARVMSEIVTFP